MKSNLKVKLKKVIKSGRENGRIIAIVASVVLFLAGVADFITVIVMALRNADDQAESLNRDVATVIMIAGAVAVVTAFYIWHKLAGFASVLEVFARGKKERVLIPSEKALISNVAVGASNV
ncbi:hypothetical protein ACJMK2_041304 [Sinanodonta woodiana]|uniref:Uncharacterized protein n=1 Tax=Sinanodonta woodiana TaxID=1069815 RepID=A0ABD3W5J3_SINWO